MNTVEIIICAVIAAAVIAAVTIIVLNKKKGRGACSCGCAGCSAKDCPHRK